MKTLCKKIIILIFIFTTLLGTTLPTNVVYASNSSNRPTMGDAIAKNNVKLVLSINNESSREVVIDGETYIEFTPDENIYMCGYQSMKIYTNGQDNNLIGATTRTLMGSTVYDLNGKQTYYVKLEAYTKATNGGTENVKKNTNQLNSSRPTQADDIKRSGKLDDIIQGDVENENVDGTQYTKIKIDESGAYSVTKKLYIKDENGKLVEAPHKTYLGVTRYEIDKNTEYYIKTDELEKASYAQYGKFAEDAKNKPTFFESVERMLSFCVRTTANGLVRLIDWAVGGGEGVTIDKIIFNQYKPTKLVYFSSERDALKEGATNPNVNSNYEYPIVHLMSKAITEWFNIFRAIAITGYTSILLYIGIQILLKATAEKQAEYKRLLIDWVVGILILFLFPTVIKTAIEMNNSLVESIGKSKGILDNDGNFTYQGTEREQTSYKPLNSSMSEEELKNYASTFDGNPFSNDNKDYMAIMARKAQQTKRLSYAIVYMIMAWQLLMLIIIYYKRLFMVGFLLVLFPLVALTYALDKVKDGRSQAFNTWGKEILLNIFIQTFHAIIYVFALGVTFEAGEAANDWILMIIGVSFLFKGEEIIKRIFGYKSSDTVDSLVSTATKTFATYQVMKKGVLAVKDNFIGKNSHLGKAIEARRSARTYEMMANNFDAFASEPTYNFPAARELPHAPAVMDSESTQLGNDIQMINHWRVADPAALAMAIDRVQAYYKNGGIYMSMLSDLKLNSYQIDGLRKIKNGAIESIKNGEDSATIEQKIKLELETLMPGVDVSKMQQALYRQMAMPLKSNHLDRNVFDGFIKGEIIDAKNRMSEIDGSTKFSPKSSRTLRDLVDKADDLTYNVYGATQGDKKIVRMAGYVEMLKARDSGDFTAKQLNEAAQYVQQHRYDSKEFGKMIDTLDYDFDEIRHVIAEKTVETYMEADGTYKSFGGMTADEISDVMTACDLAGDIKDNIENREKRIKDLKDSLTYDSSDFNERQSAAFNNEVVHLLETTYGVRDYTDEERKMAEEVWKLNNSFSFTRDSVVEAYNYVSEHMNDNDLIHKMAGKMGYDIDELGNALKHQESNSWYSNPDIDEVSVNTLIKNKHGLDLNEKDLIDRIKSQRIDQNRKEADAVREFANQVMERNQSTGPTIDGMTESDLRDLAEIERAKSRQEAMRTAVTTGAATLGVPIGAAAGVAFIEGDDDGNPIGEALLGATAGAGVMDTVAERATSGNSKKTKTYVLRNPYTGEDEEVTLTVSGAFNERIYSFDDPGLPKEVSAQIREQFIASKIEKQRKAEAEKQKEIDKENKK